MLENSVLTNESIKEIVKNNYNISITNVEKINRGSANIYKLDDKYILKEFTSDRNLQSIIKEYNVITHLVSKGLRVPAYVETIEGNCYTTCEGRIIILQIYLEGYTLENNTGNYQKTIESAKLLGALINALEDYSIDNDYNEWIDSDGLLNSIVKLETLKGKIKNDNPKRSMILDDIETKINICQKLLESKEELFTDIQNVTMKTCHGDYSVQQLIFNDELGTAIIDFETVKKMPFIWEVIRSYSYIDEKCKNGQFNLDTFIEYVKKVGEYVKFSEYDLKYMPYIYILQLVGSTFGYKQYNEDYTKTSLLDFAIFRTNLCRYLYENLENMSLKLLEISDK